MLARVPYFPRVDGNVVATAIERQPGGVGANVAVGLARLGNRVTLLGATGDDEAGVWMRQTLAEAGVDVGKLLVRAGQATHSCFIAVTPHGERIIYGLPGTTTVETPGELNHEAIRAAQALHIAPAFKDVAMAAITVARRHGLFISYAPGDVYWPEGPSTVRQIARQVDLLIVNRVEAAGLTGLNDPERAMERLMEWGYSPLVLTRGERGVLVGRRKQIVHIPAYPMPDIEDTTGAGDAFTAGLVTGSLLELPLTRAARLGTAVAALKLRQRGAQAGLPTLEEALGLALQQAEAVIPSGDTE